MVTAVPPYAKLRLAVCVVQGEEAQALHFMHEIQDRLGVDAIAPVRGEEVEI